MSNSLDPDQDRHCVTPDQGPNCLQRLSGDDKITSSKKRENLIDVMSSQHTMM